MVVVARSILYNNKVFIERVTTDFLGKGKPEVWGGLTMEDDAPVIYGLEFQVGPCTVTIFIHIFFKQATTSFTVFFS